MVPVKLTKKKTVNSDNDDAGKVQTAKNLKIHVIVDSDQSKRAIVLIGGEFLNSRIQPNQRSFLCL